MPALRRTLPHALLALATVVAACSDPSGPDAPTGVRIVAGGDVTDTVLTRPLQALVIEVRDDGGAIVPNAIVRFESLRAEGSPPVDDPWNPSPPYTAYVSRLEQTFYATTLVDTTDARGRVSALVQLGTRAGPAGIVVSVPELGMADTARFTVTPGAAVQVQVLPADTAVFAGKTFALRGAVADRFGNARTEPVTYALGAGSAGGISLSGATVTTQSTGRWLVVVQAGTAADTAFVSVVPEATLAANTGTAIVSFKTDGTAITTLAPTTQRSLTTDWSPDGAEVVYDEEYVGQLRVVNVASKNVRVASSGGAIYGRFAADGQALYYSQQSWRLRRQRRDGTGDELVPMTSPVSDVYGAPSPDGARVAYVTTFGFGSDELKMLTLATGASTSLGIAGHSPNWSPTGALIAFVDASTAELKLVNPDGTNVRAISPAGRYQRGIDWSPDGRWIAAWNVATNKIDLIDTQSTLVLPLGFTLGWTAPSWKP